MESRAAALSAVGGRAHDGGHVGVHGAKNVGERARVESGVPDYLHDISVVIVVAVDGIADAAQGAIVGAAQP
jgi:hypothetical protein